MNCTHTEMCKWMKNKRRKYQERKTTRYNKWWNVPAFIDNWNIQIDEHDVTMDAHKSVKESHSLFLYWIKFQFIYFVSLWNKYHQNHTSIHLKTFGNFQSIKRSSKIDLSKYWSSWDINSSTIQTFIQHTTTKTTIITFTDSHIFTK